jgi:hypothetical protein
MTQQCTYGPCANVAWMRITCDMIHYARPPLVENVCMDHVAATLRAMADACDRGEAIARDALNAPRPRDRNGQA